MRRFIPPSVPKLRLHPPLSPGWQHEVKFDGYRAQLHKAEFPIIYTRNGADYTKKLPSIAEAVGKVKARTCIIDGELVAHNAEGDIDFHELHPLRETADIAVWCFDLLELDGTDFRDFPLYVRRAKLKNLDLRPPLYFSDAFDDPKRLLASCNARGLEGIVSKRLNGKYHSGSGDWLKIKCPAWKERHKDRGKMFDKL